MKKQLLSISVVFLGALCLTNCAPDPSYDLAIQNVLLFDSRNKNVIANKTVLISSDTIAAIIDASGNFDAQTTITGNGRLLVPGFIDTHTHLMQNYGSSSETAPEPLPQDDLDLIRDLMTHQYLSYGVTTIIDMGQPESWMDVTLNWQKNPDSDHPNLFICGGSIVSDEDRRQPQHHIEVMGPEDGRRKVRTYAEMGLKHMKLYRKLQKQDMEAMVDEAKKYGITINTHTDNNVVTIQEAMNMGIKNFEHFFTVTPSILDYDEHWTKMNEEYGIRMSPSIDEFAAHMVYFFGYINDHPQFEARLKALFEHMAQEGATLSTAVNVLASAAGKTDFFTSFEYFPIRRKPMVSYSTTQKEQLEKAFDHMMGYLKMAHDKGVRLRIGTDCRFGGKSLLRELELFYKAGIPMTDILQIATWNGYEAMKLEDRYGSIEVGKKADVVLFDKNPFEDFENLKSEKIIIKGGKLLDYKKSLAYDLRDLMIDEGIDVAKDWFNRNKNNGAYGEMDPAELKNVISELLGTGRMEEALAVVKIRSEYFPDVPMKVDGIGLVNGTYALLRNNDVSKAIAHYEFSQKHFPEARTTLPLALRIATLQDGVKAGQKRFSDLRGNKRYTLEEAEMNGVGYLLMQLDRLEEAIGVFELNVSAFPDSWNVYDSLG
ncbi:amidohydrolase family protein [Flavobacteriaceae bacterium TP-CH-4]|uniref:Amidohydrolase family protein n=1 Tax=Pelagihabitans pacificus TaxID=2696054 RepID=A0A967E5Z0_9FLAO|nr:amidohydrolase family protein [Pelagihabitans pacificus]NHF59942.1 amidohydrolase family protein [Pelagihabitans pacificus]